LTRHTPDAVAASLTRLLSDAAARDRMAAAARASARRFATPVIAQSYDAVFAEALA
jgi:UDP-N-acetylglucosamine:LPS N-acetylglucosamine transferase